jgi:predicted DNA-binding transcriptional regulator AlpA
VSARTLLSTEDIAQLLDVDPSTVRRWRTAEPIQGPPFIHISERVTKYRPEDVEQWLHDRRVVPQAA